MTSTKGLQDRLVKPSHLGRRDRMGLTGGQNTETITATADVLLCDAMTRSQLSFSCHSASANAQEVKKRTISVTRKTDNSNMEQKKENNYGSKQHQERKRQAEKGRRSWGKKERKRCDTRKELEKSFCSQWCCYCSTVEDAGSKMEEIAIQVGSWLLRTVECLYQDIRMMCSLTRTDPHSLSPSFFGVRLSKSQVAEQ